MVLAAALLGASTASAAAVTLNGPDQASLVDGGPVRPTGAWVEFCQRSPADCAVDPSQPATITLDDVTMNAMIRINHAVNTHIKPITDQEHWGVGDRWDYPSDGEGDCEDFQIEKRRELAAAGLSERAMRMVMVINPEGEGHAVLLVRTNKGDYVLDNRVDVVLPWYRTGYVWVKREGDGTPTWISLGNVKAPVETAARP